MHPLISIISFIVCAISLSLSVDLPASLITFCVCLISIFFIKNGMSRWRTLLWRLRWFFMSIVILYVGFTPGVLVWPGAYWSPSYEGLRLGFMRLLILLDIFTLVFILHSRISREKVLAGLHALCWPLQIITGFRDKLVMRLILTFDYVEKLPKIYKQVSKDCDPDFRPVARVVYVLQKMIQGTTVSETSESVTFNRLPNPAWYEWSYPLALAAVYQWIFTI